MPARGLSRFVPLFVIVALILALTAVYAPGVIRAWKFRTTVNAMLDDVEAGRVSKVPGYVIPGQKLLVTTFVNMPLVTRNVDNVGSLKLTSYYREENHVWAVGTGKQKDGTLLGQGKLRWVWDGKQWQFDALNSYVSYGIGFGENQAVRIQDLLDSATNNKTGDAEDAFDR